MNYKKTKTKKKQNKDSLNKTLAQAEGKHILSHGKGYPIAKSCKPRGKAGDHSYLLYVHGVLTT